MSLNLPLGKRYAVYWFARNLLIREASSML